MKKNFPKWNLLQNHLEKRKKLPSFQEREIWWASFGINLGSEMCGKGEHLVRPILVIKKFNRDLLFVLPLSSKHKNNCEYYYKFLLNSKKQSALLSQVRVISAKRLLNKEGKVSEKLFEEIKEVLEEVLFP